jgi:hypothetical protein
VIWLAWPVALGIGAVTWWLGRHTDCFRLPEEDLTKADVDRRIEALERVYHRS